MGCIFINTLCNILLFAGFFLMVFVFPAVAADPAEENYQQIQESFARVEQYNGTALTSAAYLEKVWPQVYAKVSKSNRQNLANFFHVWELKPLHENGTGLGFGLTDALGA